MLALMVGRVAISIIVFLLSTFSAHSQGLMFASYDVHASERTSLNVLHDAKVRFSDEICVEFDMQAHSFKDFGYIFQVWNQSDNISYGLTISQFKDDSTQFKFALLGEQALIQIVFCNKDIEYRWLPIKVIFDLNTKSVSISVNGITHSIGNVKLPSLMEPEIYFGRTDTSVEVPFMSIRRLAVYDRKSRFDFKLSESEGQQVHDAKGEVVGRVVNPIWLIKDSYHWQYRFTYETTNISSVNFDSNTQEFLFVDKDSLVRYNVISEVRSACPINTPIHMQLGTSFINVGDNHLYMYELNNLPEGETTVASLNLDDMTWQAVSREWLPTQRHHHSSLYDSVENRYIIFGGFGNQKYHNEFCELDIENGHFSSLAFTGDEIEPRFFTALGVRNRDVCYLFAGVGNKTGDKSVGNITYRDLYEVNIRKRTIKQLWNLDHLPDDKISVRDMYVDTVKNCIYTMQYIPQETYPYLNLYSYSINDGTSVMLGDSIRISSNDIRSNANLWYSAKLNMFFCTMQEFERDGTTKVNVYSLHAPAVSMAELSLDAQCSGGWLLYLLVAVAVAVILGVVAWRRRWHSHRSDESLVPSAQATRQSMPTSNAVYLFGSFTVYDRVGTDISHLFGYKMRQMFTLLLLNLRDGGAGSMKMYDVLWADKDIVKAKNIKGVMLTNLKKILLDIDGVDVIHHDNRYTIKISNKFYCDYLYYQSLVDSSGRTELLSQVNVGIIQEILDRGPFLKNIDNENFDSYKKDVDEYALCVMTRQLRQYCESRDYGNMLHVSKTLFNIDALSESALCGYVYAQSKLNNLASAQKKYVHFISTYSLSLGEQYPYSLDQLLESVARDVLLHK